MFELIDLNYNGAFIISEFPVNGGENSAAVFAENVIVIPSPGDHKNGSSKVKLSNLVDYSWEERFYPGQLLAAHMSGSYIAYSIKGRSFLFVCMFN